MLPFIEGGRILSNDSPISTNPTPCSQRGPLVHWFYLQNHLPSVWPLGDSCVAPNQAARVGSRENLLLPPSLGKQEQAWILLQSEFRDAVWYLHSVRAVQGCLWHPCKFDYATCNDKPLGRWETRSSSLSSDPLVVSRPPDKSLDVDLNPSYQGIRKLCPHWWEHLYHPVIPPIFPGAERGLSDFNGLVRAAAPRRRESGDFWSWLVVLYVSHAYVYMYTLYIYIYIRIDSPSSEISHGDFLLHDERFCQQHVKRAPDGPRFRKLLRKAHQQMREDAEQERALNP